MGKAPEIPEQEHPVLDNTRTEPLEAGTTVGGRYGIVDMLAHQDGRTVYAATEGAYLRWCPTCEDLLILDEEDEFCDECGAELTPGRYRLTEWPIEAEPAGLDVFFQARLAHDGWAPPRDWFVWADRRYMVQADRTGDMLETVVGSSTREEALTWGITLADALRTLHEYGFAGLRLLGPEDMMITPDRKIRLVNWDAFTVYPTEQAFPDEAVTAARQQDFKRLSSLLTVLLLDGAEVDEVDEEAEIDPVLRAVLSDMDAGNYTDALSVTEDLEACLYGAEAIETPDTKPERILPLRYDVGGRSDVGRVRTLNEDSLVSLDFTVIRNSQRDTIGLYVVADGIGGHDGGEIASRIAVGVIAHTITDAFMQPTLENFSDGLDEKKYAGLLSEAVQAANRAVVEAQNKHHLEKSAMGTTVTAALVVGPFAYVANVGDSRTYLLRQGAFTPVTTDHSVVARLVAIGMIHPDEVYTHPQRNAIYQALGSEQDFQVDTFVQPLLPNDQLVLCSDGLWEMVRDPEMREILLDAASPQGACDTLVSRANLNGGEDNISVIVVRASDHH